MMDPTQQIPVTLQAQQWNVILEILSNQPWRTVAPLIEAITGQANAIKTSADILPMTPPNGEDRHVSDR